MMLTLNTFLHFIAAGCCTGVAVFALTRDSRSLVHRAFAMGMVILAVESVFNGLCDYTLVPEQAMRWQQWRLIATATLSGTWLLFTLSFGKADPRPLLYKWKWVVLVVFLPLLIFAGLFQKDFFQGDPLFHASGWEFTLGWPGYGFYICFLLSLVLVIIILEKTLQASRGRKRWQVKFLVLGIGGYFAFRIYASSHALIFRTLNLESNVINAASLLVANLLMLISILRAGVLKMDIYPSHRLLYNSFTVMVVGVYFLALGLSAKISSPFLPYSLLSLMIFLGLLGLLMILLSDRVRLKTKRFISRHLERPQYDYREIWRMFTGRTASLIQEKAFCESVVKLISEMFDVLNVSIWLIDENQKGFRCSGSTAISETGARNLPLIHSGFSDIVQRLHQESALIDLEEPADMRFSVFDQAHKDLFSGIRTRYLVSLSVGDDLLGFISMGDPVKYRSLSLEEKDILGTIAEQVAAGLLNIKLSQRIQEAGEMEAFQTVAAFFVHDLKNLASKLSMVLENLPNHFDNPEFRGDALKMMSRSVDQINTICSRLSLVREKLEIHPCETDLNQVVKAVLAGCNGFSPGCLVEKLQDLPRVFADSEQIQKVLFNLILNANDAVGGNGKIHVTTCAIDGWVELSVKDNGCGMSKAFMDQSLFRPFKTTKTKGTGIGLFQSKMIVEAHNGHMEVESREGEGSTFRVLLPVLKT
jgi:putative PEP-CTERM system histidine kinase